MDEFARAQRGRDLEDAWRDEPECSSLACEEANEEARVDGEKRGYRAALLLGCAFAFDVGALGLDGAASAAAEADAGCEYAIGDIIEGVLS